MSKTRIIRLYKKQNGLCWICNLPMLPPPKNPSKINTPHAYEATIDHLAPKNIGLLRNLPRPTKAAHSTCNSIRHHYPITNPKVQRHIQRMQNKFESPTVVLHVNRARCKFLNIVIEAKFNKEIFNSAIQK